MCDCRIHELCPSLFFLNAALGSLYFLTFVELWLPTTSNHELLIASIVSLIVSYTHVKMMFASDIFFSFFGVNIIVINKLFEIDFETNVSDKSFIEERFEAIMASLSSSDNKYR